MNPQGSATEAHDRHMETLKGMRDTKQIAEYIDEVKRAEGPFYAKWLRDDFGAWWTKQQPKRGRA